MAERASRKYVKEESGGKEAIEWREWEEKREKRERKKRSPYSLIVNAVQEPSLSFRTPGWSPSGSCVHVLVFRPPYFAVWELGDVTSRTKIFS